LPAQHTQPQATSRGLWLSVLSGQNKPSTTRVKSGS